MNGLTDPLSRDELDALPSLTIIRTKDGMLAAVKLGKKAWIVTGHAHIVPTAYHLFNKIDSDWVLVDRGDNRD